MKKSNFTFLERTTLFRLVSCRARYDNESSSSSPSFLVKKLSPRKNWTPNVGFPLLTIHSADGRWYAATRSCSREDRGCKNVTQFVDTAWKPRCLKSQHQYKCQPYMATHPYRSHSTGDISVWRRPRGFHRVKSRTGLILKKKIDRHISNKY